MEKTRLALGSPMAEPYLSQLEALCQITPALYPGGVAA